jgi:hypothetical protein
VSQRAAYAHAVGNTVCMYTVLTDITLLGHADHLVFTFSSNFGQAALFLSSALRGLRPSYIAMDDVFEGFRWRLASVSASYKYLTPTT